MDKNTTLINKHGYCIENNPKKMLKFHYTPEKGSKINVDQLQDIVNEKSTKINPRLHVEVDFSGKERKYEFTIPYKKHKDFKN